MLARVLDVIVLEDEVLHQVCDLPHSAGNGIAPTEGIFPEEGIETSLAVDEARLPEALSIVSS